MAKEKKNDKQLRNKWYSHSLTPPPLKKVFTKKIHNDFLFSKKAIKLKQIKNMFCFISMTAILLKNI